MRRIESLDDIAAELDALCAVDPRLSVIRERAGQVPLRLVEPGFSSLVSIIVSQQVSRASADAIFGRLALSIDPLTWQAVLAAEASVFRAAGLSAAKHRTILAVANAMCAGLDLDVIARLEGDAALAALTAIPGIGPWTAQCYLLFAAGHRDIMPAGDVALQSAVGHALGMPARPTARQLASLAESWSPHRGAAARLFWSYYREMRGREAAPDAGVAEKPAKP